MSIRQSSPALFLAIVSVGTRFWHTHSLHLRYFDIIALLDKAISQLLLCASPQDASLHSIRALMVYLQWMPCSLKEAHESTLQGARPHSTKLKARYNDMSAWAVFGLALRYASFLNLERLTLAPFCSPMKTAVSEEDLDRMRLWLNLVTYDCNLTLTSGLPGSLDPSQTVRFVRDFCSHRSAQQPGDTRYAALVELACILKRAKNNDGEISNRHPNVASLKKANVDMEEWERYAAYLNDAYNIDSNHHVGIG
jgi:hypothetical protein